MDSTQLMGIALGGIVIATLGAIAEYSRDKDTFPNYKGLARDFIVGAILVLFLLQIVPESMSSIFDKLPSLRSLSDSLPSVSVGGGSPGVSFEPDLQVGPARF